MKVVTNENVDELMANIGAVINSEPFKAMMREYENKICVFMENLVARLCSDDYTSGPLGIFLEMQKGYHDFSDLIVEQDKIRDYMTKKALKMD